MTDYYIIGRTNGYDLETGNTINLRGNLGQTIAPSNPQSPPYKLHQAGLLHAASAKYWSCIWNGNNDLHKPVHHPTPQGTYEIPLNHCSFFRVTGTPVAQNSEDTTIACFGFLSLYIAEELTQAEFESGLPW